MSVAIPADHRTQPRRKNPPSFRDQKIFIAYRTQGRTQESLAKEYLLSQRRISQIIQRVEQWQRAVGWDLAASPRVGPDRDERTTGGCEPVGWAVPTRPTESPNHEVGEAHPTAAGPRQRRLLERELERARAQSIYDRSLRAFDHAPKELKWVKKGERDGKSFWEETCREQPPNVQLLKTALRANADLGRVNEREPIENALTQDQAELFEQVVQGLLQLRSMAARVNDKVCPDDYPERTIRELLKLLVGEPCQRLGWETVMIDGCLAAGDHFRRVKRGQTIDDEQALLPVTETDTVYPRLPQAVGWAAPTLPTTAPNQDQVGEADPTASASTHSSFPGSPLGTHDPGHPLGGSAPASADASPDGKEEGTLHAPYESAPTASKASPDECNASHCDSSTCDQERGAEKRQNAPPTGWPEEDAASRRRESLAAGIDPPGDANSALDSRPPGNEQPPATSVGHWKYYAPPRPSWRRQQMLDQHRELVASGKPFWMTIEEDEGPPPLTHYQVNDPGWQPTVPDPREQAQRVREYLQELAAQSAANAHRLAGFHEENLRPIREALLKEQRNKPCP